MDCFNSRVSQNFECPAGVFRVWVRRADDDFAQSGRDDGLRAGRGAPVRGARLKRDIQRGSADIASPALRCAKSFDFGMRQTSAAMPSAPDDFSVFDEHRADHRVG